jgi:signal transduction histidine kinase
MYTKKEDNPCYRVDVDWNIIANATNLSECEIDIRQVPTPKSLGNHGTILRIQELKRKWDFGKDSDLPDLRMELARFVPPFKEQPDFNIYLTLPGEEQKNVRLSPPKFLSQPPYLIKGTVSHKGILKFEYLYHNENNRTLSGNINLNKEDLQFFPPRYIFPDAFPTECGPFDFEIRLWDLEKEALLELGKRFDLGKKVTDIRKLVAKSPFNGISLYRDGVLVLPKETGGDKRQEPGGFDWLGLNLRRVSRVGTRISANQIIGYVTISADQNPNLRDTADRERLVDNRASRQFRTFLFRIISFLEQSREKDRLEPHHKEPPLKDLFEDLRTPALVKSLEELRKSKGNWEQVSLVAKEYTRSVVKAVSEIQRRFIYYSRLASVGSLAMLLQHEIGNKVPVLDSLNKYLRENLQFLSRLAFLERKLQLSENAVRSLQRLADIFSPLASQTFGTRRRNSNLEDIIQQVGEWFEKDIHRLHIKLQVDSAGPTIVAIDPGELIPIIVNLMTNALYWLEMVSEDREIFIEISPNNDGTRVDIRFHDSGPGVEDGLEEMIFWPGVTKKEEGIGMGLTVASELVAQHNGKMYLIKPGELEGASFGFDLPLTRKLK